VTAKRAQPAQGRASSRRPAVKPRRSAGPGHTSTNQDPLSELIGTSPALQKVRETIRGLVRQGGERPNVLLEGEAGSGKTLVAGLLSRLGRPEAPIVALNCAATPEVLLGGLLLGPAPEDTGSSWIKPGLLELVAGGTIVLEEVSLLPQAVKAMVAKAIDDPPRRRASNRSSGRLVHTWIIGTCNTDVDEALRRGYFGRGLFRRLAGVRIKMPPLRERGKDVLILAEWLLPRICAREHRPRLTLAPEVGPLLLRYSWPGNVRELTSTLTRAVLLTTDSVISVEDLDLPLERTAQISWEEFEAKIRDLKGAP
jgi:DNA-binding NtrC family response regulator